MVNTSEHSIKQHSCNYVHIYKTPGLPVSKWQYVTQVRKKEMINVHITMRLNNDNYFQFLFILYYC